MKKFKTLFFDLDATLYPASNGLWETIKNRISGYMIKRMGLPAEQVPGLRQKYYQTYGTTLSGLRKHYKVNPEDYLNYVHNIPLADYLSPDPQLRAMLESLPQNLWVFTNSDEPHAKRVLSALGIEDLFDGVADLYALDFQIKPNPQAYRRTLELAGNPDPQTCVLFDDLAPNLVTAQKMGFYTVFVTKDGSQIKADLHIQDLLELPAKMPGLWDR